MLGVEDGRKVAVNNALEFGKRVRDWGDKGLYFKSVKA